MEWIFFGYTHMKLKIKTGVYFFFGFLLGVLNGCLENPGPDKHLGIEKRHAHFSSVLPNHEAIEFDLTQDLRKINLKVTNDFRGPEIYDSLDFIIQLKKINPYLLDTRYFLEDAVFEYYGHMEKLSPYETRNLGLIGSLVDYEIQDLELQINFIKASYKDSILNSKWSGIYKGTYLGTSDTLYGHAGNFHAYIDAQGNTDIFLHANTFVNDSIALIPFAPYYNEGWHYAEYYYSEHHILFNVLGGLIDAKHGKWMMLNPHYYRQSLLAVDTVTFNFESITPR